MNHVLPGVLADATFSSDPPSEDTLDRARTAIEEILVVAYEQGDWTAVRTLHAVSALLGAFRH
jgi:hypothetical protein